MNGKIKFYKEEKGYGFLRNEKGEDAFFHIKDYTIKDGELPTLGTSVTSPVWLSIICFTIRGFMQVPLLAIVLTAVII